MVNREFKVKMILVYAESLAKADAEGDTKAFFTLLAHMFNELKTLNQRKTR